MAVRLERHLFSLEEYERMVEAGAFTGNTRIELIRGEIVDMAPIGFEHGMGAAKLNRHFSKTVGDKALVWVQSPIQLAPNSRPEPDLALLRWQDYGAERPVSASDVLLVIEVSDTTLKYDRAVKGPLYAEAGIPEYWIVDLQSRQIEVYSNPLNGAYQGMVQAKHSDTLVLPMGLGSILLDDL